MNTERGRTKPGKKNQDVNQKNYKTITKPKQKH